MWVTVCVGSITDGLLFETVIVTFQDTPPPGELERKRSDCPSGYIACMAVSALMMYCGLVASSIASRKSSTSSSWMNLVDRWCAELTTKWLRRGTHRSLAAVVRSVEAWVANWNAHPRPVIWHKAADQILDNLTGYRNRLPHCGH